MKKLVFVGAGSMAEAMMSGIVKNKLLAPENIWITNKANKQKLAELHEQYGVSTTYDLNTLFAGAEAVVLAMKPKDAVSAIKEIQNYLSDQMLVISVLAGISLNTLEDLSGKALPIARAMPNTSAAVGKSATGVAVNDSVTPEQMEEIKKLFETIGLSVFVAEEQIDAVTGVSGSGPAYIYYLVEAMEKGALEVGLDQNTAKELIVQTLLGAAEMLKISPKPAQQLRKEVTSPGGTTEAGIKVLEENRVNQAMIDCIKAAAVKSQKMGAAFGSELHTSK
jgi:pyrroline-5-carboxylate reductase